MSTFAKHLAAVESGEKTACNFRFVTLRNIYSTAFNGANHMPEISEILCTFVLSNGERVQASISREGSSRWGADKSELAKCVDACKAISEAMADFWGIEE